MSFVFHDGRRVASSLQQPTDILIQYKYKLAWKTSRSDIKDTGRNIFRYCAVSAQCGLAAKDPVETKVRGGNRRTVFIITMSYHYFSGKDLFRACFKQSRTQLRP